MLYHNDRKLPNSGYKEIFYLLKFSVLLFFSRKIWGLVFHIVMLFWRSMGSMVVQSVWEKHNPRVDLSVFCPVPGSSLASCSTVMGTASATCSHHQAPRYFIISCLSCCDDLKPWWSQYESFRLLVVSVGYSAQSDAIATNTLLEMGMPGMQFLGTFLWVKTTHLSKPLKR